jgi:hypothetical protein
MSNMEFLNPEFNSKNNCCNQNYGQSQLKSYRELNGKYVPKFLGAKISPEEKLFKN